MKTLKLLLFLLFSTSAGFAQIDLSKGKDLLKKKVKDVATVDNAKDLVKNKLAASRNEYDTTNFNYAVSLRDNAGLFEAEEKFKKNQKMLAEVVSATDDQKNTPQQNASNLNEVGEMMFASNKFTTAEYSFKGAIMQYKKAGDTLNPSYALVLSNMGLLYHTTGRYNLSETFTRKALDLRKSTVNNTAAYAASVNNLAVLYKDMGRYNESEPLILEAISVNEASVGKTSVTYALSLNNQAMLYQAMGRYPQAEPILKQAIDIAEAGLKEKSTNFVRLMMNLALLYQDMGKYNDAETLYLKALKIREGKLGNNHPDYAHLLNELASLYIQMGKTDKVEDLLKRSMAIYKKNFGESHPSYATAISNLGTFYRTSGRAAEAEPLLSQALQIRKTTLSEDHPDYVNSLENMGLLYWQTSRIPQAMETLKQVQEKNIQHINTYFAPMSEAEKARFWDKIRPKFQRFYSFVADVKNSDPSLLGEMYNYQLATKALLLNSTNKVKQLILNGTDEQLKKDYLEWLDTKENLARLYTMSKAELIEEKINLDSLERAANAKEKMLSSKSKLFNQQYEQEPITFKQIAGKLLANEAAVEIIQLHKFNVVTTDTIQYAALILKKESAVGPELVLLDNGNQLEKRYYNYYKNSIRQKTKDEFSYEQYWGRLEKAMGDKQIIYVSLDGIYNQINLNTLQMASGQYLLEKKHLIFLTNSKDVLKLKETGGSTVNNNATLIGFPNYGTAGTIAKLPGTKIEVENIAKVLTANNYSVKTFLENGATEQKVKSLKSPKILHIATHGFFLAESDATENEKVFGISTEKSNANPLLRSGLLMADAEKAMDGTSENGILTAYEVMNLLLDNTEIVVVSACETGLGDVKNGEGVYGLQRAFQVAGSKSIIMSLWKVNDAATQELMSSFYKNYSLSNNKEAAFKKAQLELKTKFKEPYYWGAFVLVE
ncbi:MAG: CHAT domain-containing protein [Cytophagaceae bacterium]